jgi:hypothetical protein
MSWRSSVLAPAVAWVVGNLVLLSGADARASATMVIDDADPAGQGLNDTTPFVPVGGNTAPTLGVARLSVFQRAASIWGSSLSSAVPVHVTTQFVPLTCSSTSALLAQTGPNTVHRNFASAPFADTWYPQALANAIAGTDLDPSSADISTEFNSSLGATGCLTGTTWYLGFDGHPGPGQLDMLTVVLHELAHGLGFQFFYDLATGATLLGSNDVFMLNAQEFGANPMTLSDMSDAQRVTASESDPDLYWAGTHVQANASTLSAGLIAGHVRLHAPATEVPGSSVSHFSPALFPNQLMEPNYMGPNHDVTLTLDLLRDVGWSIGASSPAVPAIPHTARWILPLALAVIAARRLRRAPPSLNQARGSGTAPVM